MYIRGLAFTIGLILCSTVATAWARPPAEIQLIYDKDLKRLHIEVRHVSKNPRKHFIRKLLLSKNNKELESFSYVQQTTAAALIQDVSLESVTGDVITVEAVCNEAGRKEETLIIP